MTFWEILCYVCLVIFGFSVLNILYHYIRKRCNGE